MIGKTVNGYTITHKIGEGGMAEVYYAENQLRKSASVKVLKKSLCEVEGITERFRNEAEVMVKLNHPNIRQVYDYAEIDGRPAIIMEYLEGGDLSARLKRGERFSAAQVGKWWDQMADALNYTHAKGVVHRDIKPSNIFIDAEGNVRLLDFGIAKVKESITSTQTGAAMGTLLYMSPEQIDDVKRVDYRTDVYSLAVTFVHLLTGKAPYDATTTSDYQIRKSIVEKPLDLTALPAAWRSFLASYLAKERDRRPALVHFSESANASIPMQDKPIQETFSAGDKTVLDETKKPKTDIPTSQIEESIQQPIRSRKMLWIALSGATLLVVALVIVLSVMKHKKSHPEEIVLEDIEVETVEAEIIKDAVKDYDGNSYDAVQIGDQVWMAENLRTKHYADGTSIPQGSILSVTTPYWYYPDGNSGNASRYGLLYNWPAVMHNASSSNSNPSGVQGICPDGWHVPSKTEWTQLDNYVAEQEEFGDDGDLKFTAKALASKEGWNSNIESGTVGIDPNYNNSTGFNAIPLNDIATFWSTTQSGKKHAYKCYLASWSKILELEDIGYGKNESNSVRCIKD